MSVQPGEMPNRLLEAALLYASKGLAVFPLHWIIDVRARKCSCRKPTCEPRNAGKHPVVGKGLNEASTDPDVIRAWWTQWPQAHIGIRTGGGVAVIDTDVKGNGPETWTELQAKHGGLERGPWVRTPHGGAHYYVAVPAMRCTVAVLGPGVDTRGDGGYVVAPPSAGYTWQIELADEAIPECPAWVSRALERRQAPASEVHADYIISGARNATLTSRAGGLRKYGASEDEICNVLQRLNETQCRPPLDPKEVQTIARSVARYEPADAHKAVAQNDRTALTAKDVIDQWQAEGPLVHHPTGFRTLDELTGGGPVFGSRWYVMGAPDAGKTQFMSLFAQVWNEMGLIVGMLAVDEEPQDLVGRFIQRFGFFRKETEDRETSVLDKMREAVSSLHVRFYGPEWTIEAAGQDVADACVLAGKRGALMVDSVQTVECEALRVERKGELSMRERITENVRAIRGVASGHKLILVATSEMNRAAYKDVKRSDQNDMAAAKESGAVEYSARVMLALRVEPDEADCVELRVVKNKHGPSAPAVDSIYLSVDRGRQMLTERVAPVVSGDRQPLGKALLECLARHPEGITTEALVAKTSRGKPLVQKKLKELVELDMVRRMSGPKSPWVLVTDE